MDTHIQVDPLIFKIATWALGFLFTSLIAVVVWLSKNIYTKITEIADAQVVASEATKVLTKDIDDLKEDLNELKENLKTIPELKESLSVLDTKTANNQENFSDFKRLALKNQEKLNNVEKAVVALQAKK